MNLPFVQIHCYSDQIDKSRFYFVFVNSGDDVWYLLCSVFNWILIFAIFGFKNPEIAVRIRLKVFKKKPLVSVCYAMLEIH